MNREEEIKNKLKAFLIETLEIDENLLTDDALLFGDSEIGLGSIDGLEIIAFADSEYGVEMTGIPREHFATVNAIAAYIASNAENEESADGEDVGEKTESEEGSAN